MTEIEKKELIDQLEHYLEHRESRVVLINWCRDNIADLTDKAVAHKMNGFLTKGE